MTLRSRFSDSWPTLLAVVSAGLIALYFLRLFFPGFWGRRKEQLSVHISCFAYRDVNRNGVYDVGDRPYAGLKMILNRPESRPVRKESNIAGFTNFDMALNVAQLDIHTPGEHTIQIEPPANWKVTSGNNVQTARFEKREGSATGMIALRTFDAVGVAPVLRVSGAIGSKLPGGDAGNTGLEVRAPDGTSLAATRGENGTYSFPATAGTWQLELVADNGKAIARKVVVREYPVMVSRLVSEAGSMRAKPNIRTIGFDDLTPSDTLCEIPNGYAGLNWRNWVATHQKLYQGNGFINATVSSEYLAYTSSGHPATISSEETFDFLGAYVGVAWPKGEDFDVVVKAWRQDVLVHEDRFRASTAGPIYFDADYLDVSRIEFSSDGYWQVVVDDVTVGSD